MAIKAIAVDDANTHHLLIGVEQGERGYDLARRCVHLARGAAPLTADSDIVIVFAETDEELAMRFPPAPLPA